MAIIVGGTWYQVQVDVQINEWFGEFYDAIQQALGEPGSMTVDQLYALMFTFARIAGGLHHRRRVSGLLHEALGLSLASRDERLLHGPMGAPAPDRRRQPARSGRHTTLRHHHGIPGQPAPGFRHDLVRLSPDLVGTVEGDKSRAGDRPAGPCAGLRRHNTGAVRHGGARGCGHQATGIGI